MKYNIQIFFTLKKISGEKVTNIMCSKRRIFMYMGMIFKVRINDNLSTKTLKGKPIN